jgi:hypothetical protein
VSNDHLAIEPSKKLPIGHNRDRNETLLMGDEDSDMHHSPDPIPRTSDLTSGPNTDYRIAGIDKSKDEQQ